MPTPKAVHRKHKPPVRRYELKLDGDLAEFHVVMGAMSGRETIRLRSGEMTESDALEMVAAKVIEHDFDIEDLIDLDLEVLMRISLAWNQAIKDASLPPATGGS